MVEVIEKRKLSNDEVAGFLGQYPIDRVAVESSTSLVPVYRALRGKGYEILVSHPKKTRLVAESRIKTDRVDSWAVTELARLNALPLSYMPPDDIAALREKVRRGAERERATLRRQFERRRQLEAYRKSPRYKLDKLLEKQQVLLNKIAVCQRRLKKVQRRVKIWEKKVKQVDTRTEIDQDGIQTLDGEPGSMRNR
jgi:hypothetical protein